MSITQATERVHRTFHQWKRKQIPDKTAFYHTALDIAYRRGGMLERLALRRLRYQRSVLRTRIVLVRKRLSQVLELTTRLRS